MKQFEDIKKQMPYSESEDYLDKLVARTTEKAISQGKKTEPRMRPLYKVIAAAAAALLLLTFGITQFRPQGEQVAIAQQESLSLMTDNSMASAVDQGPIDDFLNGLTDEEVQMLAYYEMSDIPEYE